MCYFSMNFTLLFLSLSLYLFLVLYLAMSISISISISSILCLCASCSFTYLSLMVCSELTAENQIRLCIIIRSVSLGLSATWAIWDKKQTQQQQPKTRLNLLDLTSLPENEYYKYIAEKQSTGTPMRKRQLNLKCSSFFLFTMVLTEHI